MMHRRLLFASIGILLTLWGCSHPDGNLVKIKGGKLKNKNSAFYNKDVEVSDFYRSI